MIRIKINHLTNSEIDMLLKLSDIVEDGDREAIYIVACDPFNEYLVDDLQSYRQASNQIKPYKEKVKTRYGYTGGMLDDFGLVLEKWYQVGNTWKPGGYEQVSQKKLRHLFETKKISEADYVEAMNVFLETKPSETEKLNLLLKDIEKRKKTFHYKRVGKSYIKAKTR